MCDKWNRIRGNVNSEVVSQPCGCSEEAVTMEWEDFQSEHHCKSGWKEEKQADQPARGGGGGGVGDGEGGRRA